MKRSLVIVLFEKDRIEKIFTIAENKETALLYELFDTDLALFDKELGKQKNWRDVEWRIEVHETSVYESLEETFAAIDLEI